MPPSPINRREFLGMCACASAGALLGATPRANKFIDMHTHISPSWGPQPGLSADDLLKWMDEHEVEKAIVLPLVSPESWNFPVPVDYVLEHTKPHRDRLIPFCSTDPRAIVNGKKGIVDLLKRYVDAGARGFGEHKPGVAMDAPRNLEVFEACAELKLPVLFHMDNVRNTDTPGLPGLDKVLTSFPDTVFIGHGPGWWASICEKATQEELGGYPKRKVEGPGAIDMLMEKHANLYGELSAGSGANALQRDPKFGQQFLLRRAARLMFGTDYLAPDQKVPQFKLLDSIELPDDVRSRIYRDNAARLLSLGR